MARRGNLLKTDSHSVDQLGLNACTTISGMMRDYLFIAKSLLYYLSLHTAPALAQISAQASQKTTGQFLSALAPNIMTG